MSGLVEPTAGRLAGITAFLTMLPAAPLVVIEEPKITAVSGMWFEAARRAGFDVAAVVALRHPRCAARVRHQDEQDAVEEFLSADLRHHRHCGPVTEPFGTDWVSVVYRALGAAARDEPWDQSALDRVFQAYRASEHGFRIALEDSRRYRRLNRLMRPFVVKLALEGLAAAPRRKGTWA